MKARILDETIVAFLGLALVVHVAADSNGPKTYRSDDPNIEELRKGVDSPSARSRRIEQECVDRWSHVRTFGAGDSSFRWKAITLRADGKVEIEWQRTGLERAEVLKGTWALIHKGTSPPWAFLLTPVMIRQITASGGQVILTWTGPSPRYQVQQKAGLDLPWENVGDPVPQTNWTNAVTGPLGFFRVVGLAER